MQSPANHLAHGVLLILLAAVMIGCKKPPDTYRESELADPEIVRLASTKYWRRTNFPRLTMSDSRRVAMVDFTVEFVTEMLEAPTWKGPDDEEEKPEAKALRLGHFKPKKVIFDSDFRQQLTDEIYAILVRELEKTSRQIVPAAEITASQSYQLAKTVAGPQTMLLGQIHREDPDFSYPRKVLVHAAGGLRIFKKTPNDRAAQIAVALLREIGADVAVRARFRVGVHRGRATIKRGSRVWVLSRRVRGNMILKRTLLSDTRVVTDDDFRLVNPDDYTVDSEKYLATMRRLFPTLLRLGFASGDPTLEN